MPFESASKLLYIQNERYDSKAATRSRFVSIHKSCTPLLIVIDSSFALWNNRAKCDTLPKTCGFVA